MWDGRWHILDVVSGIHGAVRWSQLHTSKISYWFPKFFNFIIFMCVVCVFFIGSEFYDIVNYLEISTPTQHRCSMPNLMKTQERWRNEQRKRNEKSEKFSKTYFLLQYIYLFIYLYDRQDTDARRNIRTNGERHLLCFNIVDHRRVYVFSYLIIHQWRHWTWCIISKLLKMLECLREKFRA